MHFLMTMISYLQFFEDVNKRSGRLTCDIPLLESGLAPFSFIDVDESKYTKELLTFYELGRHDLITEAYVEGYAAPAARYDAYVGRDRRETELEYKRRSDIYAAVRDYVLRSVETGAKPQAEEFRSEQFTQDDAETKATLCGGPATSSTVFRKAITSATASAARHSIFTTS
jgi:Fic family protein